MTLLVCILLMPVSLATITVVSVSTDDGSGGSSGPISIVVAFASLGASIAGVVQVARRRVDPAASMLLASIILLALAIGIGTYAMS